MLEPVSDCWPRRMATTASAVQNPAYRSVLNFCITRSRSYARLLCYKVCNKLSNKKYDIPSSEMVSTISAIGALLFWVFGSFPQSFLFSLHTHSRGQARKLISSSGYSGDFRLRLIPSISPETCCVILCARLLNLQQVNLTVL